MVTRNENSIQPECTGEKDCAWHGGMSQVQLLGFYETFKKHDQFSQYLSLSPAYE